jgi:hypothetical protein
MSYLTLFLHSPLFIYVFLALIPPEWCGTVLSLAGEKFVNVPEVNLELCKRYGAEIV